MTVGKNEGESPQFSDYYGALFGMPVIWLSLLCVKYISLHMNICVLKCCCVFNRFGITKHIAT